MNHTALRQYPTPHQVKSLDQVIFPFISYFSHDESLCFILLLIFFLIYHLICHPVLRWNFLEDSYDSLMSNHLQISEMLLSHSGFPHVYKEAVLPQRKDNQSSGFILSSAIFSKVLNSTVLTTASGFVSKSHQGLNHFDYIIRVFILLHQAYFSIRSQRLSISFEEYIEYFLYCTNLEVKFLCYCFVICI